MTATACAFGHAGTPPMPTGAGSAPGPGWRWLGLCGLVVFLAHAALLHTGLDLLAGSPSTPPVVTLQSRMVPSHIEQTQAAPATPRPVATNRPPARPPGSTVPAATPAIATPGDAPPSAKPDPGEVLPPPAEAAQARPDSAVISPTTALQVRLPASGTLLYDVIAHKAGNQNQAEAELRFEHNGKDYTAQLITGNWLGKRIDSSRGQLGEAGLMPQRYSLKTSRERAAHFVWAEGKIVFSSNRPSIPLLPGAQDRLSVMIQLAALIGTDPPAWPAGRTLSMLVASSDFADLWTFRVIGADPVQTGSQSLPALKLERQPLHEHAPRVEVWLAQALGYMPARIRLSSSNGDIVDQVWRNPQQ